MKFKLDKNVPWILKNVIESVGQHEVDSVFHEGITGIDDKKLNIKCLKSSQVAELKDLLLIENILTNIFLS